LGGKSGIILLLELNLLFAWLKKLGVINQGVINHAPTKNMKFHLYKNLSGGFALNFLTCFFCGCLNTNQPINLASVDYIEPREIVLGEDVNILGSGFVQGNVEVVFDGKWKAGGKQPVSKKVVFKGEAIDENRVLFKVARETLEFICALHVFFEGKVLVIMKSQRHGGKLYLRGIRERVKLDFLDVEPEGSNSCPDKSKEVSEFLRNIGISVEERQGEGLLVKTVEKGKSAFKAGLKDGDLLLVANGLFLYFIEDILPPEGTSVLSLILKRDGEAKPESLKLRLSVPTPERIGWQDVLPFVVGFLLVLILRSNYVRKIIKEQKENEENEKEIGEDRLVLQELRMPPGIFSYIFPVTILFPIVTFMAICAYRYGEVISSNWVCGILFVFLVIGSIGEPRKSKFFTSVGRKIFVGAAILFPVALIFILRWLRVSSLDLRSLGSEQMFEPWHWNATRDPFSLLLTIIVLILAGVPERRGSMLIRNMVMQINSVVVISFIVLSMLGGFELPNSIGITNGLEKEALSIVLFIAKVLILYFLFQNAGWRGLTYGYSATPINLLFLVLISGGAFIGAVILGPVVEERVSYSGIILTGILVSFALLCALFRGEKQQYIANLNVNRDNCSKIALSEKC